jgi:BirA family biotin operon repressor/biotin-[acetyl-CoA-carboxylase] ligase
MVRHVVVGIGMDVNVDSGEFPDDVRQLATSLRAVTGRAVDRAQLATQILRELDADYQRLLQGRFDEISSEWMERCRTIGREVTISMGDRRLVGRAEALDIDGALLVRSEHGRLERVVGGDVRVERSQA